jgi:hypothetical protein
VYDGFHGLPPIPTPGERNSGFRREKGKLLKQVPQDRFFFIGRGEEIQEPTCYARRLNEICCGGHEWL